MTMGTTTKGIPYPEGTDRVMDGDNAMQAIAVKVDELLPRTLTGTSTTDSSGYFTLTHNVGVTPKAAYVALNGTAGALWAVFFTDTFTTTTLRVRVTDGPGATAPNGTSVNWRAVLIFT
jgi:hypothetical protein